MIINIAFQLGIASVLLTFGWWSRAHVADFCASTLPPEERRRRMRVLVRGSYACQVAGVVFVAMLVPLVAR